MSPALWGGLALAIGLGAAAYLTLAPTSQLPMDRRRPGTPASPGPLGAAAGAATRGVERVLRRRGKNPAPALERAGVKMRPQDFVFLVVVGMLATAALGAVLSGPLPALLLAALVPAGAKLWLGVLTGRRQKAFADQLDDSLQLMASSLRAGHSLPQALASVARESEEPTSEEFSRIINETRVGRGLGEALDETAERMGSQDFLWVAQAIAINREVGGNLAEVLDGVGQTIRERGQVRRQVAALAAEGKLSAIILMALPVGILGFLSVSNPAYIAKFTQSLMGYGMLTAGAILLLVGGVWLKKTITIKF